mgnify:CR=1 FL=1
MDTPFVVRLHYILARARVDILDISKDITDMLRHDKDDHVCKSCESELFEEVITIEGLLK